MHMKIKCLFLLSPILAGVLSWGAQPTLAPLFLGGPAGIAGNGALGIFVNGPYAYVAAGTNGLVILDITDSQRPVKIGVYDTPGIATDVFIQGNLAFVADGSKGSLQIIDVQHPESPKFVASKLYNEVQGVLAAGHYVYLATGIGGLLVLDFNDPSHLVTTGVYDTPRNATSVKLFDNVLYVTDSFAGLFIFDMADPSRPAKIGQFDTAGYLGDVHVLGRFAYLADGASGLSIVDVSVPATPVLVGRNLSTKFAYKVLVDGGRAFVATGITGWQMVDVSDPVAPVVRAIYHLNGAAAHAAKSGDKYWVVDGDGGVNILQEGSNQISQEFTLINPGWSKTAGFTVLVPVISGSYALEHRASVDAPWTVRSSFSTTLPGVRRVNDVSANARPNGFYRMTRN